MSQSAFSKKILLCWVLLHVCFLGVAFFWLIVGEPVHDVNAWVLEKGFYASSISHSDDSVLLERKKYLGGPSLHGGNRCIYAVGETRSAQLSKEEIKKTYKDKTIWYWNKKIPLQIIFLDEFDGDYTMPYANWQDDLIILSRQPEKTAGTLYTVFASVERRIILFDYRCDD